MSIRWFDTEDELEAEASRIEELQFEHLYLKQQVDDRRKDLEDAEQELADFEEENKEFLIN